MKQPKSIPHPGKRIKEEVIPADMSVTEAARLIGVGRPALSNLLNGKASLSSEMATRLSKTFNYSREALTDMQVRYDEDKASLEKVPSDTRAYVPPFLQIKSRHIEEWASNNIPARSRFSVFLRTLVHSTGSGLTQVDFPGNDDGERPGSDGFVECDEGTPWVPAGRSVWEFGTNKEVKPKADSDFDKSVEALDKNIRRDTTFIFVTPRHWSNKKAWITERQKQGLWKNVRAYDASDLEQWLEQSLAAQAWFANETQLPADGVRSLDKCWFDWAHVANPILTASLFDSAVEAHRRTMLSRLKAANGPIRIAADSTEEALAFLAQLFNERHGKELAACRDQILVFDKPGVLPRLAQGAQSFIPVVFTRNVEYELAPLAEVMRSIIIYPRNATGSEPHVVLEPASYSTFSYALEEMGNDRDDIKCLTNESGRSLTVLRRRLATVPAVKMPEWAEDHEEVTRLVPFLLVGVWNSTNDFDQLILESLAGGKPYDELERDCQRLTQLNDTPVWSIGSLRGVVSKIDLLYAINHAITSTDLKRFFECANDVLGEDDPALDLPEDQRWIAPIYGKQREFSEAFRDGISETLVLLAVHGRQLFESRLGINPETEAEKVVRKLLPTPLTKRVLEANDRALPTYAEASPEVFLEIIESDLQSEDPATLGLLRPVDAGIFGQTPNRTGLLWALEGLSWNPDLLHRSASILARLSQVEIKDNWVNKPANSLESIFRSWMPQTSASYEDRVRLIRALAKRFPEVIWKICISQFGIRHRVGDYSHKPRWRTDGYGFGEPLQSAEEVLAFEREMVEMALTWEHYSLSMLCDLVERLHSLPEASQNRVWKLVEEWANKKATDADKAELREKIRVSIFSRRAIRGKNQVSGDAGLGARAKAAYTDLEPKNLLNKHAWLFRKPWVEESAEEMDDLNQLDFEARDQRIQALRVDATQEIYKELGVHGLFQLACQGGAAEVLGRLSVTHILSERKLPKLVGYALDPILEDRGDIQSSKNLVGGILGALSADSQYQKIIKDVTSSLSEEATVKLLLLAPFKKRTWTIVDTLKEKHRDKYWHDVRPIWIFDSDEELLEAVRRLSAAKRPRAAFECIRFHPEKLSPEKLYRILSDIAKANSESPEEFPLEHYSIEKSFEHLNEDSALTLDQMASLEFAYLKILARPWNPQNKHGIPNLEAYINIHPELFVQAIVWAYKRSDDGVDPEEFQVSPGQEMTMAERGRDLLEAIEHVPGYDEAGKLDASRLAVWISVVRQNCADLRRASIADICIGKLLSNAPTGTDGVWPCEEVRSVLEEIQSEDIMAGTRNGAYNSRGVHIRGEGGEQERELAEKYREWGCTIRSSYPFVASKLLLAVAKTYEREASREDTEAQVRRRLH